ncbi:MAG TPA: ribosomal-processing cysteine protease Prp [Pseudogracilibacillus sp.]|nr:ribosomal-processing cysteine protease Prp [Pseudogracilibacillus sp.]
MIDVIIFKNNETIKAFEISGHADSGPYGYDLVCAAVSAISFGSVNALMEIGNINPKIEQGDDGGYLYVELPDESTSIQTIQTILKAMVVSLKTIEQEYHEFIQIQ